MTSRLPLAGVVVAVLGAFVALRAREVFEHSYLPLAAVLAPLVSALLVVVVPPAQRPFRWVLQSLVVLVSLTAGVAAAGGEVPADVAGALVRGLASNLAASWPVSVGGPTVGGVVLATSVVGVVSVELAAARRSGPVVLAPVGVLVALLGALSAPAGAPGVASLVVLAAGFVAVLRLAELARRPAAQLIDPARLAGAPAVVVTGALVLAGVVGLAVALTPDARWDPRDELDPPRRAEVGISPLSLVDGWRRLDPAEVMFRTDAYGERPWRLVALTRYDGRSWMPAADYRPGGRVLRRAPDDVPLRTTTVELEALASPWLPAPDGVVEVSEPVLVDGGIGGLLLDRSAPEGLRYDVVAATVEPSTTAEAATDADPVLVDAEVPASVVDLAVELTAGARSDYERALLLAARLRREYQLDPEAPGGHSLLVLEQFLRKERPGREEQFVAAYAVLAAAVDLPVRVVVGFELEPDAGGGVARSSLVSAWPEVEFEGAGWIPFEAVPDEPGQEALSEEDRAAPPASGEQLLRPQSPEPTPPTTLPPVDDDGRTTSTARLPVPPAPLAAGGSLLAVAAAYVAGVLWVKRRRRQQRRQAPPDRRVTGAFTSGVEVLVDLGAPTRASATNRELVAAGAPQARGHAAPLEHLADAATAAVFGPEPPDEGPAELAWQRLDEFERSLAGSVGRLRWARARLSLRSLRRRL